MPILCIRRVLPGRWTCQLCVSGLVWCAFFHMLGPSKLKLARPHGLEGSCWRLHNRHGHIYIYICLPFWWVVLRVGNKFFLNMNCYWINEKTMFYKKLYYHKKVLRDKPESIATVDSFSDTDSATSKMDHYNYLPCLNYGQLSESPMFGQLYHLYFPDWFVF